ncbi:dehydrogenase [Mycetocola tolaasinivorans]|uniref:Dehydrogenase n=1 Tax=Mycetocola tolaasinivorans TaxID=76635 RepID=A0A3L6ZWT3_9MICO|nr:SseB family protein [Mycetocola tolaasinivorans]RLP72220.1 dehydrogenase [Mycetocola tolaasinivorans]
MAKKKQPSFRSEQLAEALAEQDMAKVAFALRNHSFVVPLMKPRTGDKPTADQSADVWLYRAPDTGKVALLLFSDAKNKPDALPPFVALHRGLWLHDFLRTHGAEIDTVFFDIAGPHPLQAPASEIMRVLDI